MSRPFKHPDTGMYWLRKRVPDDLRSVIGKSEVKKTLGTKDPGEAKRRHAAALAEIEAEWAALGKGASAGLTEAVIAEFEQAICDRWLAHHADGRQQSFWRSGEFDRLWEPETNPFHIVPTAPVQVAAGDIDPLGDPTGRWRMKLFAYQCVDEFAKERSLDVDGESRLRLAKAASRGLQRASVQMKPPLGWGDTSLAVANAGKMAAYGLKRAVAGGEALDLCRYLGGVDTRTKTRREDGVQLPPRHEKS